MAGPNAMLGAAQSQHLAPPPYARTRARPMAAPPPPPLLFLLLLLSLAVAAAARIVPVEYLYPPFNLTYFHFIDTNGVFLLSPNANFSAAVYNAGSISGDSQSRFFFSVLHSASRTPVWTATAAGSTILESVVLSLSATGLTLFDPSAAQPEPAWSTPHLRQPVAALQLLDTGELALIDDENTTLWSSFERPTDTLLPGQALPLAVPLTSSASDQDLSPGAYRLLLTPNDAFLQWATASNASSGFLTYWALSSDPAAVQDSNHAVASMAVNASGLYLLAANGRDTVYRLIFPSPPAPLKAESRLLKVDPSGRLRALTLTAGASLSTVWAAPANDCDLPLPCRSLSLCTPGGNGSTCSCPDAFSTYSSGGCAPADGSALSIIPDTCVAGKQVRYSYVSLGDGIGYLPNKFSLPDTSGDALPACRDLCSANCSCLGFFYKNSSSSCFLLNNQIGSVFRANTDVAVGFIKTLPPPPHSKGSSSLSFITIVFGIVLPTVAVVLISFLLYAMRAQWLKRRRPQLKSGGSGSKSSWFKLPAMLSSRASPIPSAIEVAASGDLDEDVLIPGLPTRFTYSDLDAATDGFKWQIGAGGFGSVYRGELPDRSTVAVKRMNGLGTQGRREFLTEIAVIGNVHHVNLVKLRGFCAEGARQLLVYEYMSRGSLDQSLFRAGAATLDWPARLHVCIGAARGLAYLHVGCDRKILHCDVKPENILLDDRGGVKIADFGLAKLMSPEQSGLFTTMRGTRGYLAPEWLMNAPITDKADVYSFGMVLLEIVRGRKNSKRDAASATSLEGSGAGLERSSYFPALALDLHDQGRYGELVDPRLEGRANVEEVSRVVRVALCCLHEDAVLRPNMTAVAAMLDGSMDVGKPRTEILQYLKMYGRGLVDLRPVGWMDGGKGKGKASDTTGSWSLPSCVSAQQLSGPR
ncbi:G-type lectin S-receptor-like serine/threonine-protein kinase At5g35370 [Phragmites australis]|uniref:G-type lectin S-receptor-like serine/threonine-protein kinase At5g35370 n=1 Tax=Phragmites australis TaxID=29695 RepID=UPI002D792827|nr:G-type lectin S-receptor-like serine/threonine-protein kinase At5g35370 [Phragmites australis]